VLHKVLGEHSLDNAYADVNLGSHHHGINGATVSDILHTLQAGTIPRLVKTIIGIMTDSQKALIDRLVEELFSGGNNRSSERMLFPRVSFTRGFPSLTLLDVEGKTGQLFVIAALLQLERGMEVLASRFAKDFDSRRANHAKRGKKKAERHPHVDEVEGGNSEDVADDAVLYNMCSMGSEGSSSLSEACASDDEHTTANSDTDSGVTRILEILQRLDLGYVSPSPGPSPGLRSYLTSPSVRRPTVRRRCGFSQRRSPLISLIY
jgi:hypothetical protein